MKKSLIYLLSEFGFTKALSFVDSTVAKINRGVAAISLYQILTASLLGLAVLNLTGLIIFSAVYWETGGSLQWPWISLFSVTGTLSFLGLIGAYTMHQAITKKESYAVDSSAHEMTSQLEVMLIKWLEESVAKDERVSHEQKLQEKIERLEKSIELMSEAIAEMEDEDQDSAQILRHPLR